jgi:hypothetical protein
MNLQRILAVLLVISSGSVALAAEPFSAPLPRTPQQAGVIGSAYGFCQGQALWVTRASQLHPQLKPRLELLHQRFHTASGNACDDVALLLQATMEGTEDGLGWSQWLESFNAPFIQRMAPQLEALDSLQVAEAFADELASRVEGNVDESIARYLVASSRAFRRNPQLQWPTWTKRWVSTGHPKARGMRVRVSYPVAFTGADPSANHMLRKWTLSLADNSLVMLSISLFPYAPGETLQDAVRELEHVDATEFALSVLAETPGSRLVESRSVRFLNRPALLVNGIQEGENLAISMVMNQLQVYGLVEQGYIVAGCAPLVMKENAATLDDLFRRYQPLCMQYLSSIQQETLGH